MHMSITHHLFAADKDLTLSFDRAAAVKAPLENLLLPSERQDSATSVLPLLYRRKLKDTLDSDLLEVAAL